eukprot:TRINITY_DN1157_c0_g1_i1.p2 TRINITY_DN1157_c0_g1~~TRINITY_DN1157_c0_g1_i1.p2  ORF type:complete len:100 (-),score=35.19 TRINITY_DN1157_c0_g1_i1:53-352(-)
MFDNVTEWLLEIEKHTKHDVDIMLVGNKSDLEHKREVTTEEAQKFADEHGCEFFETSALEGTNVTEMFMQLLKTMKKTEDDQEKAREEEEEKGKEKQVK